MRFAKSMATNLLLKCRQSMSAYCAMSYLNYRVQLEIGLRRRPCGRGRASPAVRRDGLRRPAQRRLLRRPGLDLRPRRPSPVPEPPPDPDGRRAGRRPAEGPNIHTIAIQVPISMLTRDGSTPSDPMSAKAVLGVWSGASRRKVAGPRRQREGAEGQRAVGAGLAPRQPAVQRGDRPDRRQGPLERASTRSTTREFAQYVNQPELARLLPVLYPGVFPNLAAYTKPTGPTFTRSCSRAFRPESSPGSRTSPGRGRRTCCG